MTNKENAPAPSKPDTKATVKSDDGANLMPAAPLPPVPKEANPSPISTGSLKFKKILVPDPNQPGKAVESTHEQLLRAELQRHGHCTHNLQQKVIEEGLRPHCAEVRLQIIPMIDAAKERAFAKIKETISPLLADPTGCTLVRGESLTNLDASAKRLWPFTAYGQTLDGLSGSAPVDGAAGSDYWLRICDSLTAAREKFPEIF